MKKPDDSDLTPEQYSKVRQEAERALAKADALGCFPTPVAEVMAAAEVEEAPDDVLRSCWVKAFFCVSFYNILRYDFFRGGICYARVSQ